LDSLVVDVEDFFNSIIVSWKDMNNYNTDQGEVFTFFPYISSYTFIFPICVIKTGNIVVFHWIGFDMKTNNITEVEQYYEKYIDFDKLPLYNLGSFKEECFSFANLLKCLKDIINIPENTPIYFEKQNELFILEEKYIKTIVAIKNSDKIDKICHKGGIDIDLLLGNKSINTKENVEVSQNEYSDKNTENNNIDNKNNELGNDLNNSNTTKSPPKLNVLRGNMADENSFIKIINNNENN